MRFLATLSLCSLITVAAQAQGDVCASANMIAACFHPSASFVGCEAGANGRAKVYFKGGLTKRPYQLEYERQSRPGETRIVLLSDNAVVPPSPRCKLRDWHSSK